MPPASPGMLTPWSPKSVVTGSQEKLGPVTASHDALAEMCYAMPSSCRSFAQVTVHRLFCILTYCSYRQVLEI